jgi:hypothetical protein
MRWANVQTTSMLPATRQRTLEMRLAAPEPFTAPEICASSRAGSRSESRREQRGDQDLLDHAVALDGVGAGGEEDRADDPAEQCVRGTRGQADVPGGNVPRDRADQPGEDGVHGHGARVDEALADGGGDVE